MPKFMQVLNRLRIPHPPKNFLLCSIISQHFNIGCSPAPAAHNGDLILLLIHQQIKMVLPGFNWQSKLMKYYADFLEEGQMDKRQRIKLNQIG
jgi:hypothetical protein